MEEGLALFLAELGIGIIEDEPDGCKEITLPRPVPTDDHIQARTERTNNHLVTIRLESVYRQLEAKMED